MGKKKQKIILLSAAILYFLHIILFFHRSTINYLYLAGDVKTIIGKPIDMGAKWRGYESVDANIPILVMSGHADSQGVSGAGTPGEAVDRYKLAPMSPTMSDELFWNLKLTERIVMLGKKRGLNIDSYDSGVRNIENENDPRTNWSVGKEFAKRGGYPLEIHFDSYGKYGIGPGLIPALNTSLNTIDESLALNFGRFPMLFRGGLGAPKRQIRILEIGKLEGNLERNLRDLRTRDRTINLISKLIIDSIIAGLDKQQLLNPTLDEADIFLPAIYP